MESTLAKKQDNIINFILNNELISQSHSNELIPPDIIVLSFPITSLMKKISSDIILPQVLNYSTTLDGFPNWYA